MKQLVIPDVSLGAVGPEIVLVVTAILLLLLEVFTARKEKGYLAYTALGGVLLASAMTANMNGYTEMNFSGMYVVDNFASFFKLVCLLGTGMTILVSVTYTINEGISNGEYYALLLFATSGMFFMISGSDMVTIFMGLEVMSISLYALAGYTRNREKSNEAALKYFVLGALASAFLLYGIALIYGATGSTKLAIIGDSLRTGIANYHLIIIGAALLVVGFGFKISAVPFHMWAPDVYQGAPAPVTAFMSSGPKAATFAAFLRVFNEALPSMQADWWQIFWILSVMTMTVGNIMALRQTDVKRMLAYSSIAHAGYILMGFTTGDWFGVSAILFYMLVYTFMNIGVFAVVTIVARKNEEKTTFEDYTGLGYKHPIIGVTLVVLLFSLIGIPPTAGFVGKFYIFMSALQQGYVWLVIIAVVNSVISVFYYLRLTIVMYMTEGTTEALPSLSLSPSLVTALIISIYGSLWLGVMPSSYITFAQAASLIP